MERKLVRSSSDRVLGGVCGGLSQFLGIDSTIIRIFFIILAVAQGGGFFLYLVLWVLIPNENAAAAPGDFQSRMEGVRADFISATSKPNPRANLYVGAALVIAGVLFLLRNLDISWLRWLNFDLLWPLFLIAGGIALLYRRTKTS